MDYSLKLMEKSTIKLRLSTKSLKETDLIPKKPLIGGKAFT